MRLQISVRESRDVTIVDLQGRAIVRDESELVGKQLCELIDDGRCKLLLNLENLTQIDSTGVSVLAKACVSLRRQGGDLRLLRPGGHVLEVFKVLHLLEMIPSFEDEASALASFQSLGSPQNTRAPEGTTLFR